MESIAVGKLLAEGKTKRIWEAGGTAARVVVESKDDLSAGDGAKHDILQGKAAISTRTTINVFKLLKACGLPVAFLDEIDYTRFLAEHCIMIPYEVVVRREAHGSFLKRHPELLKGHYFPRLILEFFLKTSGKKWESIDLPKDDMLVRFNGGHALLYSPDEPLPRQSTPIALENYPLRELPEDLREIGRLARKTFLVLEKAWQILDRRLVDLKVEFGSNQKGALRLADVIDNDSWRVLEDGAYIDKQLYRDGADLKTVFDKYCDVAYLTKRFGIPRQQLILWRASKDDDFKPFDDTIWEYEAESACEIQKITCSIHKEPVRACEELARLIQEAPDAVVIAYVGRSNGAGPVLAAQTTVPVITVPVSWKEFPGDIWSSLRSPSETPVMTILDPQNAVLAALQILALRNPKLYAALRVKQEERLCNYATSSGFEVYR